LRFLISELDTNTGDGSMDLQTEVALAEYLDSEEPPEEGTKPPEKTKPNIKGACDC
jgi:hypothetical protein